MYVLERPVYLDVYARKTRRRDWAILETMDLGSLLFLLRVCAALPNSSGGVRQGLDTLAVVVCSI
jgi:hypothetical protein